MGVDVFFVISGYLITTIIAVEIRNGTFSLLNFYERRARRILPALFFVILACVPLVWLTLLPRHIFEFAQSVAATATFSSNIFFWLKSGYFDTAAELHPLLHTWSLAVEEQFYIVFPLALAALWKLGSRLTALILGSVALASLTVAQISTINAPSAGFYLIHTRAWELLIGSGVALWLADRPGLTSGALGNVLSAIGLGAVAGSVFLFDTSTPFPGLYALVPTLGTAAIIVFATPSTLVGHLLAVRSVVFVGLISYSAYLWHQPLLALLRHQRIGDVTSLALFGAIALSFVLAALTWRFIERPARDREAFPIRRFTLWLVPVWAGLFAMSVAAQSFYPALRDVWLARSTPELQNLFAMLDEYDVETQNWGARSDGTIDGTQALTPCRFNVRTITAEISSTLKECAEKHGAGKIILGDSHAIDTFGTIASRFDTPFLVGLTQGSCRPHAPSAECQYVPLLEFVLNNPGVIDHVIFEQAGFYLLRQEHGPPGSRRQFEDVPLAGTIAPLLVDHTRVDATIAYLDALSGHVNVTWFGPRAAPHIPISMVYRHGCDHAYDYRSNQSEAYDALDRHLETALAGRSSLRFLSQNDVFKFDFPKDFMSCDVRYWTDGDHLSRLGEITFGKRLPDDFLNF